MPKIIIPPIAAPSQSDGDGVVKLHQRIVGALQSLVTQINASPFTKDVANDILDMGNNRITGVTTPVTDSDAVNLGFLKRSFKGGQQGQTGGGGGSQYYEIVFFNGSDMATGTQAQYNVGAARTGTPIEANISALTPPTGASIKVNFLVNGTGTVLTSDLTLGAGVSTCVAATNIASGISFQHNDMIMIVVNQVGSSIPGSRVSVGLVVRKS